MTEALSRLQEAMTETPRPTPFVGAGFSSAATSGAEHASWRGLLLEGVKVCQRVGSPMPPGWADRMRDQLDNADVFTYLATADEITRRLRAVREGNEFATWMENTVGGLRATPEGVKIIKAVRDLRRFVVTTNYDTLVEDLSPPWRSYTWTDEGYESAQEEQDVVIHLHGVVREPRSIILSSADYERLEQQQLNQVLKSHLFLSRRFIFIGCGDGLHDPDLAPLWEYVRRLLPQGKEHYLLVTGGQLRQLNAHPISQRISPVAYGSSFDALRTFLQDLVAGNEINASQDPEYYERLAAGPGALLELAVPAWEKLQGARDALRRAVRTMDQVERRGSRPAGMPAWDYRDQKAVHEQLAASVLGPARHLESRLVQLVPLFEDADRYIGRLAGGQFDRFPTELEPMVETVSELEGLTWRLRERVTQARDDLQARTEISADYRRSRDVLSRAHESIDHANSIASSLRDSLARPRPAGRGPDRTTTSTEASGTARPDLQVVPNVPSGEPDVRPAQPDVRRVPLLWEVAAGTPMAADASNVRGYLALPAEHVRGDEVFMLEVRGDSMTGEDGVLEGDYVIVDREARWDDGDMVVVLVGDEGGATLKRIWRQGGSIRLESSNPDHRPQIYDKNDQPTIVGKVIGVTRWRIQRGRHHPEPPGGRGY